MKPFSLSSISLYWHVFFYFISTLKKELRNGNISIGVIYHAPLLKVIENILLDFPLLISVLILNLKSNLPV